MEVEEDQDYSEEDWYPIPLNHPDFPQSVQQNLHGVDPDSEADLNKAEADVKAKKSPLASLIDLKGKVEAQVTEVEKMLANHPISTSVLQAKLDDLDRAWI